MHPCISVIVPVYKVEAYLKKCVDSILGQTYQNLEIILVDDGSPDNCGEICDEYAARDPRIKVIHKPNGGLSDARNAGLDVCTGEYIGFVDSDDWIEPHMYQRLYELIQQFNADMAFGGVADDVLQGNIVRTVKTSDYGETPFAEDNVAAMRRYFHGSWAAWDKLYRAELFREIRYPVGEINEDEAIVLPLLDRCNAVCYTNEVFYHYVRRVDGTSITTSAFSEKKLAWPKHCRDNLAFIRAKYPQLEESAVARYRSSLLWVLREMALSEKSFPAAHAEVMAQLKENRAAFLRAPFNNKSDRMRYLFMVSVPFPVLKTILKLRHRK